MPQIAIRRSDDGCSVFRTNAQLPSPGGFSLAFDFGVRGAGPLSITESLRRRKHRQEARTFGAQTAVLETVSHSLRRAWRSHRVRCFFSSRAVENMLFLRQLRCGARVSQISEKLYLSHRGVCYITLPRKQSSSEIYDCQQTDLPFIRARLQLRRARSDGTRPVFHLLDPLKQRAKIGL